MTDVNEIVQVRRKSCPNCYKGQPQIQPDAECQKCGGEGEAYIYVSDTRQLTGAARLLYAGARKTREGIEVVLRDQDAALVNIARSIGVFEEKEQKPADIQAVVQSLRDMTDPNEASRIYQSIMRS